MICGVQNVTCPMRNTYITVATVIIDYAPSSFFFLSGGISSYNVRGSKSTAKVNTTIVIFNFN